MLTPLTSRPSNTVDEPMKHPCTVTPSFALRNETKRSKRSSSLKIHPFYNLTLGLREKNRSHSEDQANNVCVVPTGHLCITSRARSSMLELRRTLSIPLLASIIAAKSARPAASAPALVETSSSRSLLPSFSYTEVTVEGCFKRRFQRGSSRVGGGTSGSSTWSALSFSIRYNGSKWHMNSFKCFARSDRCWIRSSSSVTFVLL